MIDINLLPPKQEILLSSISSMASRLAFGNFRRKLLRRSRNKYARGWLVRARTRRVRFWRVFGQLLHSPNLPLYSAWSAASQVADRKLKRLVSVVKEDFVNGFCFSEAMMKHPKTFCKAEIALVELGEQSGMLYETTQRLAEVLQKRKGRAIFWRIYAEIVSSGLPSLEIWELASQAADRKLRRIVSNVRRDVGHDLPLSKAMMKHPKTFCKAEIALIELGERFRMPYETAQSLAEIIQVRKGRAIFWRIYYEIMCSDMSSIYNELSSLDIWKFASQAADKKLRRVALDVMKDLENGDFLPDIMEKYPEVFSHIEIAVVRPSWMD